MIKTIIKESRPATLVVTLLTTTLGIVTAYDKGYIFNNYLWDIWRIILVSMAGLLLQSGVNLINNFFEEDVSQEILSSRTSKFLGLKRSYNEILIFKAGLLFLLITSLIGIYLSYYSGLTLFVIEVIGIFSAYAYSGRPFNYKNYGLGAIMSFLMMGPLMCYASFYVFAKSFSMEPILLSFTMGLFIPSILIANELRDYEEDKRKGVGTLTVRIGFNNGRILYYSLIALAYINVIILVLIKYIPVISIIVVSTLPLVIKIPSYMQHKKKLLIPQTAKLYLCFGIQLLAALILQNHK